jgi:hypothetical protein
MKIRWKIYRPMESVKDLECYELDGFKTEELAEAHRLTLKEPDAWRVTSYDSSWHEEI